MEFVWLAIAEQWRTAYLCSRARAEIDNNGVRLIAGCDSATGVYSCDDFGVWGVLLECVIPTC